jgi:hypothetical protein
MASSWYDFMTSIFTPAAEPPPPSPVAAHQPPTNTSALQQLTHVTQRTGLR